MGGGGGGEGSVLVCAVVEVVHYDFEGDGLVGWAEERLLVLGDEVEVVKVRELVDRGRFGERFIFIIHQPAGDVVVEVFGEGVE